MRASSLGPGLCLACILHTSSARAIRPFITDDARIADEHTLQLETWFELNEHAVEHNALVAFGVRDDFEITMGGTHGGVHAGPARGYSITAPVLQLKLLLHEAKNNGAPGFGVSAGGTAPFGHGALAAPGWSGFGYAVLTESIADETLLLHANLGFVAGDQGREEAARSREGRAAKLLIAGVAFQLRLFEGLHAVGEVFHGDSFDLGSAYPATQGGFRYIFSDHVQMDASFGTSLGHLARDDGRRVTEQWGTLGFRLVSSRLF